MIPCYTRLLFLAISWLCLIHYINGNSIEQTKQLNKRVKRFTCPGDGKWPDEKDCERYFNCQGTQEPTGGWCGPGMAFDTEKERCDMASAVNCKDGDRPDWKPPENWEGKTKETTTTTKKASVTSKSGNGKIDTNAESGGASKEANLKENDRCNFKGLVVDKENCQSYFYCKDSEAKKALCNDRQLFDDETKSCKEFKNVYCGDRPVNDKGKDQCRSRPNGVYPNIENGCSEFYQCQSGKKVKSGECPQGLKFNMLTLRCDWPGNVPVPCGTKLASSGALSSQTVSFSTVFTATGVIILNSFVYSYLYF